MATVRRATPVRSKAVMEKMIALLTQNIEVLDAKLAEMSKEQSCFRNKTIFSRLYRGETLYKKPFEKLFDLQ